MFRDKKFTIPFIAELIMPWLILIPGIPAIIYCSKSSSSFRYDGPGPQYEAISNLFHQFYDASMTTGIIVILLELVIGLIGLIWLTIGTGKKNPNPSYTTYPLILFLCPIIFGTLILMFFVHAFTYGMGI